MYTTQIHRLKGYFNNTKVLMYDTISTISTVCRSFIFGHSIVIRCKYFISTAMRHLHYNILIWDTGARRRYRASPHRWPCREISFKVNCFQYTNLISSNCWWPLRHGIAETPKQYICIVKSKIFSL